MPVVFARTVEVSSIRCRSPVDSVAAGPVQLQVAEAEVEQRVEHAGHSLSRPVGHPAQFLRHQPGHVVRRSATQLIEGRAR